MSDNKKNSKFKLIPWAIYGLIIGVFLLINIFGNGFDFNSPKQTTLSKFYQYLDSNQVEKVVFSSDGRRSCPRVDSVNPKYRLAGFC